MTDITPSTFPKYTPNPLLIGLPAYLKESKNYDKIRRVILDAGATRHSHSEMLDWSACKTCQRKQWDRKETMKRLGFRSGVQYLEWRKVQEEIKKRRGISLPKYNTI